MQNEAIKRVAAELAELEAEYRYRRPDMASVFRKLVVLIESETRISWGRKSLPRGVCVEAVLYLRALSLDARRAAEYDLSQKLAGLEATVCGLID